VVYLSPALLHGGRECVVRSLRRFGFGLRGRVAEEGIGGAADGFVGSVMRRTSALIARAMIDSAVNPCGNTAAAAMAGMAGLLRVWMLFGIWRDRATEPRVVKRRAQRFGCGKCV
jgi:hypothetical protein